MKYNVLPEWMQPSQKDPFDYKLRSKEEVKEQTKYFPPSQDAINIEYKIDNMKTNQSSINNIEMIMTTVNEVPFIDIGKTHDRYKKAQFLSAST